MDAKPVAYDIESRPTHAQTLTPSHRLSRGLLEGTRRGERNGVSKQTTVGRHGTLPCTNKQHASANDRVQNPRLPN